MQPRAGVSPALVWAGSKSMVGLGLVACRLGRGLGTGVQPSALLPEAARGPCPTSHLLSESCGRHTAWGVGFRCKVEKA